MNLPILLAVRSCSHKCMYWYMYYIYECLRDKNSIPVSQFSSLFWSKIVFSNSVNHQNISFIIILNRTDIYVIYIVFLKKKWLHLQTHFSLSFSLNILINWYNLSNSNNKKELYFCSTSWLSLNQYQYSIFHSFFFSLSVFSLYHSSIFCYVINSYTSLFPVFVLLTSFFMGHEIIQHYHIIMKWLLCQNLPTIHTCWISQFQCSHGNRNCHQIISYNLL